MPLSIKYISVVESDGFNKHNGVILYSLKIGINQLHLNRYGNDQAVTKDE